MHFRILGLGLSFSGYLRVRASTCFVQAPQNQSAKRVCHLRVPECRRHHPEGTSGGKVGGWAPLPNPTGLIQKDKHSGRASTNAFREPNPWSHDPKNVTQPSVP